MTAPSRSSSDPSNRSSLRPGFVPLGRSVHRIWLTRLACKQPDLRFRLIARMQQEIARGGCERPGQVDELVDRILGEMAGAH